MKMKWWKTKGVVCGESMEEGKTKNENLITKFSHVSKEIIENLRTWNK